MNTKEAMVKFRKIFKNVHCKRFFKVLQIVILPMSKLREQGYTILESGKMEL